jgi:hypothetical protein
MAKLFESGNSQAIRLPKANRLPGKKVDLKRMDKGIAHRRTRRQSKPHPADAQSQRLQARVGTQGGRLDEES